MAEKPTIPDFPNLPDFGQMISQACEVVANVQGIPYDFNGTLSLENKFVVLFKTVKEMFDAQDALAKSYRALYDFVNNYFTNLDVQEEINNKIESMASDGSLFSFFRKYLSFVCIEWFGGKGNGTTDDSAALKRALSTGLPVSLEAKSYLINQSIDIPKDGCIYGCNGGSKKQTHNSTNIVNTVKLGYLFFMGESSVLSNLRIIEQAETTSCIITAKTDTDYVESNAIIENVSIMIHNKTSVGFDIGSAVENHGSANKLNNCTVQNGVYGFRIRSADNILTGVESDSAQTGAYVSNYQNIFFGCRFFNSYLRCLNVSYANSCVFYGGSIDQTLTDGRADNLMLLSKSKDVVFDGTRFQSILARPVYIGGENYSFFNCNFVDTAATCFISRNSDEDIVNCAIIGTQGITDVNKLTNYSYKINVIQNFSNVLCNTDFVKTTFSDVPEYNIICKINGATENIPAGATTPLYGVLTRKKTSDYMTDELITNDGKAFYRFHINGAWQVWHSY